MTSGSLLKFESIAECSPYSAVILTCIKRYWFLKTKFGLFESGHFTQVLLYMGLVKLSGFSCLLLCHFDISLYELVVLEETLR